MAENTDNKTPKTAGKNETPDKKKSPVEQFKSVLPLIKELVRPRRGMLALGLVLLLIGRLAGLVLPVSTKFLLDNVIHQHRPDLLKFLVAAVVSATLVQGLTSFALTQLLSREAQRLITELRRKVQAHVGKLPLNYYDANKTGALVSRIMSDVEGVRNLIGTGLVEFLGGILTAVLALSILLKINAWMTLVALGFLLVLMGAFGRAFKTIRPIFRERAKINAEVTGRLTESLGGVRVVKGYHAEEREAAVFSTGVQRLARQILAGHMTAGDLFMYTMLMGFLVAPVAQIASIGTQITEALAGLDRTREVLAERPEDRDPDRVFTLPEIKGRIAFEHVDFAYEAGKPVLEDVSFEAQPGSVTALVGSSGSGKSTMIGLVAAFYKPTAGRVLVDGVDLAQVRLDSYRPALGVVLQDSFLFDGSIRENIAFSRPDATEEQIMEACRIAHVDEFADRFPEKHNTVIGERGVKLSGGQKQRVSIARAVLADPRILILDEATSSLDSESEAYIQQGLKYLMQGRTTFVIAHRLSTIRQADQILVVEAGKVVERGKHAELLALQKRYHDLYTRQHGLEENLFLSPGEGDKVDDQNGATRAGGAPAPDAMSIIRGQGL